MKKLQKILLVNVRISLYATYGSTNGVTLCE